VVYIESNLTIDGVKVQTNRFTPTKKLKQLLKHDEVSKKLQCAAETCEESELSSSIYEFYKKRGWKYTNVPRRWDFTFKSYDNRQS